MMDIQQQPPIEPIQPTIPETPQPSRFAGFYARHAKLIWGSLITIAVAVAALLSYILFFRHGPATDPQYTGDVLLEINAPEETVSGSEISYEISATNQGRDKLQQIALEVFYPQGFSFVDSTPDPDASVTDGRRFALPDLPAGATEKIVIVGRLEGNVQEIKTVTAKIRYVPENFRATFTAQADASTVVLAPDISLEILAPAQLISGQSVSYAVRITNVSAQSFSDLVLNLTYPAKFEYIAAEPVPTRVGNNEWTIASLAPSETKTIGVVGKLLGEAGTDSFVSAELFTKRDGTRLSAGRSYAFTRMEPSPLVVTQSVKNAGVVYGGQSLEYTVNYVNRGNLGLHNVTIALDLNHPGFNPSANPTSGQFKNRMLVWTPAAVPELRVVQPGAEGKFEFHVPITDDSKLTGPNLTALARLSFVADELPDPISGNSLSFKIGTKLAATASFSPTGVPALGQSMTYTGTIRITNSLNDLENAELTAILPRADEEFVTGSFGPEAEKNSAKFTASAGQITWQLGAVPALGVKNVARTLTFQIKLTPTSQGFDFTILKDVIFTARDKFTGEQVKAPVIEQVSVR